MSADRSAPHWLLLNPPGSRLYLRDYYCSKTSKAGYLYEPVDLLILSGLLADRVRLSVLDAIAERLTPPAALERIGAIAPDGVIGLVGAVSLPEDLDFYRRLKARGGAPILVSGDAAMEDEAAFLEAVPFLDGAIVDFTDPSVLDFVLGVPGPLGAVARRQGDRVIPATRRRGPPFAVGRPRHELFPRDRYRFPFVRRTPFATVLTDYGCPYPCRFCIMGALDFKTRPVEAVLEEIDWLAAQGVRDLYFDDQTFGVKPRRTEELCRALARRRPPLGWVAFTRADLVDPDRLALYRRAGCHTLMMGVETAAPDLLEATRKGIAPGAVTRAFAQCRAAGLRTVATFLFGLDGETDAQREATIAFARRLGCDYASFNVAVPRARTAIRAADGSLLLAPMDQSGHAPGEQEGRPVDYAAWIARANRAFYLRPGYLLRRAADLRSPGELARQLSFALGLLRAGRPRYEIAPG